jgi:hypothetical protein
MKETGADAGDAVKEVAQAALNNVEQGVAAAQQNITHTAEDVESK